MASLFGITAADVQRKIAPKGTAEGFRIGAGLDMSEEDCLAVIEAKEAEVVAQMRERDRDLLRAVDGELAVAYATAGQVMVRATLTPILAGTLKVYVNLARAWVDRRPTDVLAEAGYSVNLTTGVITLGTALEEGDQVALEYEHGWATKELHLKDLATTLAAVEIVRRYGVREAEGFDRFEQWRQEAQAALDRMRGNERAVVPGLERVPVVGAKVRKRGVPNIWG